MIDESHATIPQIGGMYEGDKSRKTVLVEHGFRLPSALDNRPLRFEEFMEMTGQRLYVSRHAGAVRDRQLARRRTRPSSRCKAAQAKAARRIREASASIPAAAPNRSRTSIPRNAARRWSSSRSSARPACSIRSSRCARSRGRSTRPSSSAASGSRRGERVLVTTLTKKTAEDLTRIPAGRRPQGALHPRRHRRRRAGRDPARSSAPPTFDILVGINLLREGLDLPEVSLVCILDADKEGFLRNETSPDPDRRPRRAPHQRRVRAVLRRGDRLASSACSTSPNTAAASQIEYNEKHGITPQSVKRAVQESLHVVLKGREAQASPSSARAAATSMSPRSSANWKPKCRRPPPPSNSNAPPSSATRSKS